MPEDTLRARLAMRVLLRRFSKRDPALMLGCPRIRKARTMRRKSRATFPAIASLLGEIGRGVWLQEHAAAVGFDFNGANRMMSEKDAAEDSSPASCK
jgi:hypothetical protein